MTDAEELKAKREADALRDKNRALLIKYQTLMGKLDHSKPSAAAGGYADGRYSDLFAPDGKWEGPYMPEGLKMDRQGKEEHDADAETRFNFLGEYGFTTFEIIDCVDPNQFIMFTTGEGRTTSGSEYSNQYVFYYVFENGKIKLLREYFDPLRLNKVAEEASKHLLPAQ